jgi:hypothetical protein
LLFGDSKERVPSDEEEGAGSVVPNGQKRLATILGKTNEDRSGKRHFIKKEDVAR